MNRETGSQGSATARNLLVVQANGKILSCGVSQIYGQALLGAMGLRLNSLPFKEVHVNFLSQHESLAPNEIRKAAQAVAPGDNFMFIDDGRIIRSCRINPEYGVAIIEKLHAEEGSQTHATSSSPFRPGISGIPANSSGILSDQILSSANRQPYDRDWMTKYDINESCLHGPPSVLKIDVLLSYGALKVGDKLCIPYRSDGGLAVNFGEGGFRPSHPPIIMLTCRLSQVLECPKKGQLDVRVGPPRQDFNGILHDCQGPRDIIRGMEKEFQTQQPLNILGGLDGGRCGGGGRAGIGKSVEGPTGVPGLYG